jgi:hypothetical protein
VITRKNRITGTRITMGTQAEMGMDDPDDLPYITLCEDHGELCSHPNYRFALRHMSMPEWCSECQKIMYASGAPVHN